MSDDEAAPASKKARVQGTISAIAVPMAGKKLHKKAYKIVKKVRRAPNAAHAHHEQCCHGAVTLNLASVQTPGCSSKDAPKRREGGCQGAPKGRVGHLRNVSTLSLSLSLSLSSLRLRACIGGAAGALFWGGRGAIMGS